MIKGLSGIISTKDKTADIILRNSKVQFAVLTIFLTRYQASAINLQLIINQVSP